MEKAFLKTIRLYPTLFSVDVWICTDLEELSKCFNIRYGATSDYYLGQLSPNQTMRIDSTDNSELNGLRTIVVNLQNYDNAVIIHEIIHVIWYLSKLTGIEINRKSQEWQAYFVEYLFTEITKSEDYKEYLRNLVN
jgi:hypothetical protein